MAERKKLIIIALIAIVCMAALGGAGYFYYQYQKAQKDLQNLSSDPANAQKAATAEIQRLVQEVGKLIDLPKDEVPTVATVTDTAKLQNDAFFKNAKNGDKVLIYTKAKKAVLYDPTAKKVVEVASINVDNMPTEATGSASPSAQLKVVLRNGTATTGLASKIETKLKKSNPNLNVISKENAANFNYDNTLVVVINNSAQSLANDISKTLDASISALPKAEKKPSEGDVVVVIGKDNI